MKLNKIIAKRQRVYYLLLAFATVLTLLFALGTYRTQLNSYRARRTQTAYNNEIASNLKQAKTKEERLEAKEAAKVPYRRYLKENYALYLENEGGLAAPKPRSQGGIGLNLAFVLTAYVVGLLIAVRDALGGFDRFLFGLGATRQKIFWQKLRPVLGLTAALSALVPAAMIAIYYMTMPADLIALSLGGVLAILFYNVLLSLSALVIGYLLGRLIQQWAALLVSAILLPVLLHLTLGEVLTNLYLNHTSGYTFFAATNLIEPGTGFWFVVALAGLTIVTGLLLGQKLYQNDSVERFGTLLTAPFMRWPLIVFLMVVVGILSLSLSSTGHFQYASLIAPVVVFAFGILWQFWPALISRQRGRE